MAKCNCACGGVYAVNFDSAFFQEVIDEIYLRKMRQLKITFFEIVEIVFEIYYFAFFDGYSFFFQECGFFFFSS